MSKEGLALERDLLKRKLENEIKSAKELEKICKPFLKTVNAGDKIDYETLQSYIEYERVRTKIVCFQDLYYYYFDNISDELVNFDTSELD